MQSSPVYCLTAKFTKYCYCKLETNSVVQYESFLSQRACHSFPYTSVLNVGRLSLIFVIYVIDGRLKSYEDF